ncbi:MAG: hypothetical protein NT105_22500 [Verrucomicrobia bacterium]|nr:hypothetical protein [Verrucomicrobiota bacterium]
MTLHNRGSTRQPALIPAASAVADVADRQHHRHLDQHADNGPSTTITFPQQRQLEFPTDESLLVALL